MAAVTRPRRRFLRPITRSYEWLTEPVTYGYPVGRIRVLEGRLLAVGRLERLVEASDFAEQRRILSETAYGELFSGAKTASDVEDALEEALERAYDFMEESRLTEPIIEFFRIRHDFLNLRMLLKTRLAGAAAPSRWSPHGSVPIETFEEAAKAGEQWAKRLPERLAAIAGEIEEQVRPPEGEETTAGAIASQIDILVDKALYERIAGIVEAQPNVWFKELGRLMVDLANLRIVLRARRFGKDEQWLKGVIIEGGNVPPETVRQNAFGPLDELRDHLHQIHQTRTSLGGIPHSAEQALDRMVIEPGKMDVVTDNIILGMAKSGRRKTTGPEPIVSYLLAMENEIKLLRIVLIAKLANVPPERIHERVRELYV